MERSEKVPRFCSQETASARPPRVHGDIERVWLVCQPLHFKLACLEGTSQTWPLRPVSSIDSWFHE